MAKSPDYYGPNIGKLVWIRQRWLASEFPPSARDPEIPEAVLVAGEAAQAAVDTIVGMHADTRNPIQITPQEEILTIGDLFKKFPTL